MDVRRSYRYRLALERVRRIADRAVLDEGQFRAEMGGFTRLNRIFDGRLDAILGDINEELWRKSA